MFAAGFLILALSVSGLPPTSGFWGKFILVKASRGSWRVVADGSHFDFRPFDQHRHIQGVDIYILARRSSGTRDGAEAWKAEAFAVRNISWLHLFLWAFWCWQHLLWVSFLKCSLELLQMARRDFYILRLYRFGFWGDAIMSLLLVNLLLMLAWGAMTGSFAELNLIFGFVLGFFAIWLIREQIGTGGYFGKTIRIFSLFMLFLKELAMSAVRVMVLVLKPKMVVHPGIFAFELTVDKDFEIALLANLITLTPGTLSVDVSADRKLLFVHALDCSDIEAAKKDIAEGFERKILEAFR